MPVYTYHKTEIDDNFSEDDDDFWSSVNAVLVCLYDTELPKLETSAHVDIKILWNISTHWFQIGQAMILHTPKILFMSK